jgi:hypothetical protein
MRTFLLIIAALSLSALVSADADKISFGSFAKSGLEGWETKIFKGETDYRIVEDDGQKVLQAKSQAAASGLVFETEYDPTVYPVLSWRWKINHILTKGDSRTRSGDDYAARIYVIFPHWFFPKTKTLNYIWANRLPKESIQPNAFTGNAMMIAVESGDEKAGQWISVRRNIIEDYRRAFGEDPPNVGAIAIMTDTDQTGESAIAWYSDIEARRQ